MRTELGNVGWQQMDEDARTPEPAMLASLAGALRQLSRGGRDSIYEVDVIMRCSPALPWRVHEAFWWCVSKGWLTRASREPDAWVVAPGAWDAIEGSAFRLAPVQAAVAEA